MKFFIRVMIDGWGYQTEPEKTDTTLGEVANEFREFIDKAGSLELKTDRGTHLILSEQAINRAIFEIEEVQE